MAQENIGRFTRIRFIASGGQANVFEALDPKLNRPVAIKQIRREMVQDSGARKRLHREAQWVANLNHPNIVTVHEYVDDTSPFIVMEYLPGNLHALLQAGSLPIARAVEISSQICDALTESHKGGLIHRDIKPSNILLTEDGTVKVTDFGIARALEVEGTLTPDGVPIGTPGYISPEQASGKPAGKISDIYSLGCVLYEMIAGKPPFTGEKWEVIRQHINDEPKPLSGQPRDVLEIFQPVVSRCLEKNPRKRFRRAQDLKAALAEALRSVEGVKRERDTTVWREPHKRTVKSSSRPNSGKTSGRRDRVRLHSRTDEKTLALVRKQLPIDEIAVRRGLTDATIVGHLESLIKHGEKFDIIVYLMPSIERMDRAEEAFHGKADTPLGQVHDELDGEFTYEELRLIRMSLQHRFDID